MKNQKSLYPVIAIDGHAASGKGTLARSLSDRLGFAYMDTGSLYRLAALTLHQNGKSPDDVPAAIAAAAQLRRDFKPSDSLNPAIRNDLIGQITSKISAIPDVRAELLGLQRDFATKPPTLVDGTPAKGAILDGRDIGTVVCPDAPLKLYVTARVEIRADRRFKELSSQGLNPDYDLVLAEMKERDARDSGRATAPLKPAEDAVILDTSDLTAAQVLDQALAMASARF